jgi:hypothetical protein
MSRQTPSLVLLIIAVVFLALGAVTLLPFSSSAVSDLGYHALCPFAPWSTLLLLLLGGISLALRRHIGAPAQ